MGLYNEPISVIRNRLKDWLISSSTGGYVQNLDLDLLNRANQWLQTYRQWDMLIDIIDLTLVERVATLPSDLKSILEVYVDNQEVGKPTLQFYEDHSDVAQRYTKRYVYDKSTGGYWQIVFPSVSPLLSNPKLKYIKLLPDFTGVNENNDSIIEYSFFPPNLILRCAQKIHSEEKGMTGDNVVPIFNAFAEELRMFETAAQFNNQAPDLTPKNRFGQPIKIRGYSMNGSTGSNGHSPYTPATMFHGY